MLLTHCGHSSTLVRHGDGEPILRNKKAAFLRELLIKIGAYAFVVSIFVLLLVRFSFGYEMIVWPTLLITYPALMLLGAAVGLGDIIELARAIRAGDVTRSDGFFVLFLAGRGIVFIGLLLTFLSFEIKLIATLL